MILEVVAKKISIKDKYVKLLCYVLFSKYFSSVDGTPSQILAFYLTKAFAKFEFSTSKGLGGDAFTRKYIISSLTLTLGQGHIRNVAQYPLHHMTYAPAKFENAMSNG